MILKKGISIVICTYNGVKRLQPTLEAIFKQEFEANIPWELIIVDNASTDNTSEFCRALIESSGFKQPYKIINEPLQGCNHARLRGLKEIQYSWLLFCDDDNHLFPDYIQTGWNILESQPQIGVLGGQGIPLFESTKPDWFDYYSASFAVGPQYQKNGVLPFNEKRKLYSAGSFFNANHLFAYYDKNFTTIMTGPKGNELTRGEDTEWCIMIQLLGFDLYYSDKLKFYHFMTNSRMQWNYYLALKKGIASGVAKIFSYNSFLKKKQISNLTFCINYLINCLYFNFMNWQFHVRKKIIPSRYTLQELAIGSRVISSTAKAYRKDFLISFNHFKQLKKYFRQSSLY